MVPGFGVSAECQSIGTSGKNYRACYLAPKTHSWCIFWAFNPRLWFPYSSFQQVRQPSIPSPVEEDTSKIRDTTGTVFIQGPSIVLPVWRCIMFNGSYLRACMKLRILQKIRFSLLEYWGLNNKPSTSCHWFLCFGTRPRHQTRAPCLGPPRLMKGKSNFLHNP